MFIFDEDGNILSIEDGNPKEELIEVSMIRNVIGDESRTSRYLDYYAVLKLRDHLNKLLGDA